MPNLALADGLHFCLANDKVVLLDLNKDRYFGLPTPTEDVFRKWASGGILTEIDVSALSPLTHKGYLVAEASSTSTTPIPNLVGPYRDLVKDDASSVAGLWTIEALAFQAVAFIELRTRPFATIVRRLRKREAGTMAAPNQVRTDLTSAFLRTRGLVESEQKCLRWALAMVNFLGHHGVHANLVIGVRGAPFMAHAWVQIEDLVLSDTLDNVLAYTPILVV